LAVEHRGFQSWKAKYGKSYTAIEESYRMGVWLENLAYVEGHNQLYKAGKESFELEMNEFADLPSEEFAARYLIKYPQQTTTKCTGAQAPTDKLPESVDWSAKGAVTHVKNQGQCGSCWSFSTTGSLEGAHFQAKGQLLSFSEQQLVDCSKSYGNHGCLGGLMNLSFFYVKDHGITTEDKYHYHGIGGLCKYDPEAEKAWTISDCTEIPVNKELPFRAAVAQQPISVAIEANHMSFQLYKTGVYSGNCGTKLDHGVLTVGYGTQDGKKFWKVKNSWG
jgi:C1A family cysteine protease